MSLVRLRLFKFEIQTIHFSPGLLQSGLIWGEIYVIFICSEVLKCSTFNGQKKYSNYF